MKKYLLAIIITIAALVRLVGLNTHMPALYGDEIAIGYNAYSILKTGRDEFGRLMPLQFESWGDQKNPVYIYLVALTQAITGPTAASIRFPSAVAGTVAVYLTYRIVIILIRSRRTALIAALLLAIAPWHLHISRGGYEANVALTLGLLSVFYLLKHFEMRRMKELALSALFLALACYCYYTTKMFAPLLLLGVWVWSKHWIVKKISWKRFIVYWVSFLCLAIPIIYLALFNGGQVRFENINIFRDPNIEVRVIRNRNFFADKDMLLAKILENKSTYYLLDSASYYLDNFSGQFLFVGGDSNVRYGLANHGMLYLIEAPLLLLGIVMMYQKNRKSWLLLVCWLLLAPLPTALVGKAYGLRSLAMLPIPQIFAAYAITRLLASFKLGYRHVVIGGIGFCYALGILNWGMRYIHQYPTYGRYWYDSAVKEQIEYAKQYEAEYSQIFLSNSYGKTDIYYSFYNSIDPQVYRESQKNAVMIDGVPATRIGKYYFVDLRPNGRPFSEMDLPDNTLIIADPTFSYGETTINAKDDGRILYQVRTVKGDKK